MRVIEVLIPPSYAPTGPEIQIREKVYAFDFLKIRIFRASYVYFCEGEFGLVRPTL
jgi:hypothetical protein